MLPFGPGVVVVRPDKYVFGIAKDRECLEHMMATIFAAILPQ
jgi:hypothetical protein